MPLPLLGWAAAAVGAAVVGYAMSDSSSSSSNNSNELKKEAKEERIKKIQKELNSYIDNTVKMFKSKYNEDIEIELNGLNTQSPIIRLSSILDLIIDNGNIKVNIKIYYNSLEKLNKQLASLKKENNELNKLKNKLEALRIQI